MHSTSKNFIFIHPQKTGGNTVTDILWPYATGYSRRTPKNNPPQGGFAITPSSYGSGAGKHDTISGYMKFMNTQTTVFATVRHPTERLLSWAYYEIRTKTGQMIQPVNFNSLMEFANLWYRKYTYHRMFHHDGQQIVHRFIRLEHIEEDLPPLLKRLEIPCPNPIPMLNVNDERQNRHIPLQINEWMKEQFPWDFDGFGYE